MINFIRIILVSFFVDICSLKTGKILANPSQNNKVCAMSKAADSCRQPNLHFNSCDFRPGIRVGGYLNVKRLIYDVNVINVFHRK